MTANIRNKRSGTAAEWAGVSDRVLGDGEVGVETDTGKQKVGDGRTSWAALPYDPGTSGTSGTAEVILRMTSDLTLTPGGFGTDLMKWGGMFDPITFDPITEIPADLGMSFTFDDTSADITTTVDGVWAYAMRVGGTADDTCGLLVGLLGYDVVDIYEPDMTADSWGIYPPVLNLASTLKLPAGTTFQFFMRMFKDATANPYVISGGPYLKLTRVA